MPIGGMSNRRGLNVVIIDTSMGQVLSAKTYDSWAYAWVHRLTGHSPVQLTDLTVFPALRNCWGDSDLALRQWHSQQRTVRHTIYLCDSHASFFFFASPDNIWTNPRNKASGSCWYLCCTSRIFGEIQWKKIGDWPKISGQ